MPLSAIKTLLKSLPICTFIAVIKHAVSRCRWSTCTSQIYQNIKRRDYFTPRDGLLLQLKIWQHFPHLLISFPSFISQENCVWHRQSFFFFCFLFISHFFHYLFFFIFPQGQLSIIISFTVEIPNQALLSVSFCYSCYHTLIVPIPQSTGTYHKRLWIRGFMRVQHAHLKSLYMIALLRNPQVQYITYLILYQSSRRFIHLYKSLYHHHLKLEKTFNPLSLRLETPGIGFSNGCNNQTKSPVKYRTVSSA